MTLLCVAVSLDRHPAHAFTSIAAAKRAGLQRRGIAGGPAVRHGRHAVGREAAPPPRAATSPGGRLATPV